MVLTFLPVNKRCIILVSGEFDHTSTLNSFFSVNAIIGVEGENFTAKVQEAPGFRDLLVQ
jgi:hypothetical protein